MWRPRRPGTTSRYPTKEGRRDEKHNRRQTASRPYAEHAPAALVCARRRRGRGGGSSGPGGGRTAVELGADHHRPASAGPHPDGPYGRLGELADRLHLPVAAMRRHRSELQLDLRRNVEDLHSCFRRRRSHAEGRRDRVEPDGSSSATSQATNLISSISAPVNTAAPIVTGTAKVGDQLAASQGTWTGGATSFAYQWQRCDANGGAASRSPTRPRRPTASARSTQAIRSVSS